MTTFFQQIYLNGFEGLQCIGGKLVQKIFSFLIINPIDYYVLHIYIDKLGLYDYKNLPLYNSDLYVGVSFSTYASMHIYTYIHTHIWKEGKRKGAIKWKKWRHFTKAEGCVKNKNTEISFHVETFQRQIFLDKWVIWMRSLLLWNDISCLPPRRVLNISDDDLMVKWRHF